MTCEPTGNDAVLKRWTTTRRVALVLEIVRGDTAAAGAARMHTLMAAYIEQ